jgi:signal transduction histidine kinase
VSIRFKVILPYLILTLIVAATGAYIVTSLVARTNNERLSNQLLQAGRAVSDEMVQQERRQVESARRVAFTIGFSEALQVGDRERGVSLAAPAAGSGSVESLMVFDAQGGEFLHLLLQTNGAMLDVSQPGRPSNYAFVTELLSENNPDSLPRRAIQIDPVDERYYYFTAHPVVFEDRMVGAVIVGTSLNILLPDLKKASFADVILYGPASQALASSLHTNEGQGLYQRTISIPADLYKSVLADDGFVEGENIEVDGSGYSIAYGPLQIGNDPLGVFAVILPQDFVFDPSIRSRDRYVLLYSLATVAVVLLGYLIARIIVNPLTRLVNVSRAIAEGDLTRRTEIKSSDEIGVLASTFDVMTENLQQRTLELEKTNQVLEQMDRTKTRFIQVSAHELRTPLTIVQGYAQMIQAKARDNELLARYSNGIVDGTERMVEIIDNMLDVSRIETNQLGVMPTEIQLHLVIGAVEKTFQPALEERRLSLVRQDLEKLPAILGDQDLLHKLFYHVIMNAIKYTPDGGRILVAGCVVHETSVEPNVQIRIQDTGVGIDPQNHELVFEKFYQTGEVLLHSSGKTKFKGGGPGLGLAIARGIVNAHGGRIWIESPGFNEAKNPGTTVFIQLPVNGLNNDNA